MSDHAAGGPVPGFVMHGAFPEATTMIAARLAALRDAAAAMIEDAAEAPGRIGQAAGLLADEAGLHSAGEVLGLAALMLVAALVAAAFAKRLLHRARNRIGSAAATSPARIATLTLEGLLLDLAPPAVFLVTSLLLDMLLFGKRGLLFVGSDVFRMVISAVIINGTIASAALIILSLPLAAKRPHLRLLPVDDATARRIAHFLRRILVIGTASWLVAETLFLTWFGDGMPRILLIAAAIVIAALSLRELRLLRPGLARSARIWHHLAVFSVFGLVVTWIHGLLIDDEPPFGRVVGTLAILLALPLADGLVRLLLRALKLRLRNVAQPVRQIFVPDETDESSALHAVERPLDGTELAAAEAEIDRALDAVGEVLHDAAAAALGIAAAILLARTWSLHLIDLLGPPSERHFLGMMVDAAVTLTVGWYAWRLFETGLAVHLAREGGGTQSRAGTVQPLLRSVGKLVIGAVALMGALSALGVSIAPLLASAGIVGIAVGFGAQTLVKDLFSGACYLIEDVFRIGDYIEAGGNAKGTVEKITFRTVALRHQNGPLHYVPYGSLGSVRNNSRDWVIDKFEIPLPIDVSSERIRRMVKKIGQQMLEDSEYASIIMMPLKAKLYRIQPGAKIFRCKIQTPPGKQFEVRAECYRRIEAALQEADIRFAELSPQVTVTTAGAVGEATPRAAQ